MPTRGPSRFIPRKRSGLVHGCIETADTACLKNCSEIRSLGKRQKVLERRFVAFLRGAALQRLLSIEWRSRQATIGQERAFGPPI